VGLGRLSQPTPVGTFTVLFLENRPGRGFSGQPF